MKLIYSQMTRRGLLRSGLALGAAAFLVPGVFAEQLARTHVAVQPLTLC